MDEKQGAPCSHAAVSETPAARSTRASMHPTQVPAGCSGANSRPSAKHIPSHPWNEDQRDRQVRQTTTPSPHTCIMAMAVAPGMQRAEAWAGGCGLGPEVKIKKSLSMGKYTNCDKPLRSPSQEAHDHLCGKPACAAKLPAEMVPLPEVKPHRKRKSLCKSGKKWKQDTEME